MGAAARSVAIAVVGLALLPAAALGASVNRDTETGVLTIVDDVAAADDIRRRRVDGDDRPGQRRRPDQRQQRLHRPSARRSSAR